MVPREEETLTNTEKELKDYKVKKRKETTNNESRS